MDFVDVRTYPGVELTVRQYMENFGIGDSQTKPAAPATAYAVQVLAVKSASQVDEMLTRLKVMGFDARVVRDTSGLFKVRVGRYSTHDEAAQVQRRLKTRLGGQPFVVEEP